MRLADYFRKHGVHCNALDETRVAFDADVCAEWESGHVVVCTPYAATVCTRLIDSLVLVTDLVAQRLWDEFSTECEEIAEECEAEGYPAHGSNYDLRCDRLYEDYATAYPDVFM